MKEYHKIKTVYNRDPETKFKTLLVGQYSIPEFEYLASNIWVFTEKVDGTNIRISIVDDKLVIGGRTDRASIPTFLLSVITELLTPKKIIEVMGNDGEDFCLYGEGYGAKIQKGGGNYKSDGTDFVLFDVRVGDWWLKREDVIDIAAKLGIQVVPTIGEGTLYNMVEVVQTGITSRWGDFIAEGIVARPKIELIARNKNRIITKIKTKDFAQCTT